MDVSRCLSVIESNRRSPIASRPRVDLSAGAVPRLSVHPAGVPRGVQADQQNESRQSQGGVRALFDRFAEGASSLAGSPWAFGVAALVLVVWALSGPLLGFTNTWQLIINTGTTIVTFLMVFLIQHSENKSSRAVQIKLDELIAVTMAASNRLIAIEDLSDEELDHLTRRFQRLAAEASPLHQRDDQLEAETQSERSH
jgi:low affinity Fe/Cu permease